MVNVPMTAARTLAYLALWEQSKRMSMTVDAGPVCQSVFLRNGRRGAPADEGWLDLIPLLMAADRGAPLPD
jgi:hypothetical protein